jgi:hypothetical protein
MKRIIEHMAECSAVFLFGFTPHLPVSILFLWRQSVQCTLEVISEGLVAQVCQAGYSQELHSLKRVSKCWSEQSAILLPIFWGYNT